MKRKCGSRRQSRVKAAERERMVRQYQVSGLTRKDFSKRYGVPLSTLGWWLAEAKGKADHEAPVVFSEVRLMPAEVKPFSAWAMEIVGPGGLIIRCRELLPVGELVRLLRDSSC